jgi:hypothetical protein
MAYEITGKLVEKYDTVQRSQTFKTREFVIETNESNGGRTFTSYIKFQCVQDRTAILDRHHIGDNVKVSFNIRGTKWEKDGRISYITNLDAWRMESVGGVAGGGVDAPANYDFSDDTPQDTDDLPF